MKAEKQVEQTVDALEVMARRIAQQEIELFFSYVYEEINTLQDYDARKNMIHVFDGASTRYRRSNRT